MAYNWDDDDALMSADTSTAVAGPSSSTFLNTSSRPPAAKRKAPGGSLMERLRSARDSDDEMDVDRAPGVDGAKESGVYSGADGTETELQQMIRHWMNERNAPALLPAQDALLGAMLDRIRRQSDTIALLRADPDSSEEEHARIVLAQTEVERVKFVVRSYIRARLLKIEKYARYIVGTPDAQERLTQIELDHARRLAQMTEAHFKNAILNGLPPQQRSLDDHTAFMPSMITEPDVTRAVFVHARKDCAPVRLPDGTALEMRKGQISLTPFVVIEQLLLRSEVELV